MVRLREMRERAGMNQIKLSNLSGVPQQTISSIESGARQSPTIDTMAALCRVLGCTLDEIYVPDGNLKSVNVDAFEDGGRGEKSVNVDAFEEGGLA